MSPLGENDPGWGPVIAYWDLILTIIAVVVVGAVTL
jgi:hypothetical protein